ncbi:MAG: GIY-YIG nuclease family protein [Desulfatiglans sp.]|jgi:putative endonuclease|nr:GIY-YIG nuclease family protein [Desulfatiglans sp.]
MPYYVYILQSELDTSYYVGSTRNLEERLEKHNQGRSKYTKTKRPRKLMYSEEYANMALACNRKKFVKTIY